MIKIIDSIKNLDFVLKISFVLAVFSLLLNFDLDLIYSSISFKTIFLLFIFMLSLKGLEISGVFLYFSNICSVFLKTKKALALVAVNLTFFASMFITNDVALIVFIPFSLYIMKDLDINKVLILSLQTIAANLGSSISPIGNPQNIFIYTFYKLNLSEFLDSIFIYVLISFFILNLIVFFFFKSDRIYFHDSSKKFNCNSFTYIISFFMCVFSVLGVFDFYVSLVVVFLLILISNYKIFFMIDYSLLFTFVFLFVFVGVNGGYFIQFLPFDNTVYNAIFLSNIISNVPATLLLYGFESDFKPLLIGVNIGGLGTLISSMANLITFRFIKTHVDRFVFFKVFTVLNIIFLVVLIFVYYFVDLNK